MLQVHDVVLSLVEFYEHERALDGEVGTCA